MFEVQSELAIFVLLMLVWTVFALYSASVFTWFVEVLVLAWRQTIAADDVAYGYDDIQVRIITIDAAGIVQSTVDAVPDGLADVRVVAEKPISVDGASVHVVPEEFTCTATHKGRALEWARREIPCDKEFVLYLDEDTLMANFEGLPEGDIVQITELPLYTGSWVTYLSEVFRIGYQREQRAFGRFRFPLYAWGGGIAIRTRLENDITWDSKTITEDTDFAWRAASATNLEFNVLDCKFRNQSPPSVMTMLKQRRRWFSGTRQDSDLLPLHYQVFLQFRLVAWGFSPLIPLITLLTFLVPGALPDLMLYRIGSLVEFATLFVVTGVGVVSYWSESKLTLLAVPWTPVLVVLNTAGALWGFVSPVEHFTVTTKVPLETVEKRNPAFEPGSLTDHDGRDDLPEQLDVHRLTTELRESFHIDDD